MSQSSMYKWRIIVFEKNRNRITHCVKWVGTISFSLLAGFWLFCAFLAWIEIMFAITIVARDDIRIITREYRVRINGIF